MKSQATAELCCTAMFAGRNLPSPFGRLVALDYYDGPTSGIAQCRKCARCYSFELAAWDSGQDVRAFAFTNTPAHEFEEIIAACRPLGEPSWPVWVPIFEGEPGVKARNDVSKLWRSGEPEFLCASEARQGTKGSRRARARTSGHRA